MVTSEMRNDYLLDLLTLQQDGKNAISAPTNWFSDEPLLEVPTEIDGVVGGLQNSILVGSKANDIARWHFFIGSPGNGKSAAMGVLCRRLISSQQCQARDEEGASITDLPSSTIPYAINLYEGNNKFPSAQVVQDASVVRNPFSADADPALELLTTLSHAWERGISLVVCTNRGVLEKAHRENHIDPQINSTPWFKILSAVVQANTSISGEITGTREFDSKKPVFKRVEIGYSYLDNQSLLLGRDTFKRLIQKATSDANWHCCGSCSVKSKCPFKANRDWLVDGEAQRKLLGILVRAEVLSGQIIVFREALALISLLLAGCPRDYDSVHPCDWVRTKAISGDIFSLAVRRIYMSLFASFCPHGLEAADRLRKQQVDTFRGFQEFLGESTSQTSVAIRHVAEARAPSTDVGVTRLIGKGGIIASLDPCRDSLPADFYDRWDSDFDAVLLSEGPYFTDIERACLRIWKELEESLELSAEHSVSETHWGLRRWSSNFLLHLGALLEGRSAWAEELDEFATLLKLMVRPSIQRTFEDKQAIKELDGRLESLLNSVTENQTNGAIRLSEAVTLTGQWVRDKLKPKTVGSESSGSVSLEVEFGGGERAILAAPMYLWLNRLATGNLDGRCFPQELLAGVTDARVRAAAKGKYAFESDVDLLIETGNNERFRLTRIDGEVGISHE